MNLIKKHPLAFFVLALIVLRIPMIWWYPAPLTDELYIIDQSFFGPGRRLPMLPSLIDMATWVGFGNWMSGKFIAMVAGVLTVIPVFFMTRRIEPDPRAAWLAAGLTAISPLVVRWSLRCMTDVPFTLFLTASIASAVYWVYQPKTRNLGAFMGFAGLAMLTRPEGVFMLPLIPGVLIAHMIRLRGEGLATTLKSSALSVWGLIPLGFWVYWRHVVNAEDAYTETLSKNLERISFDYLGEISAHFGSYTITGFYILGPVICLGVLAYAASLAEKPNKDRFWTGMGVLYVILATTFISCVHWFFSIRHMVFMFPAMISLAVVGLWHYRNRFPRTIKGLFAAQFLLSALVLCVGLWVTKDSFLDIKEAAIAARADGFKGTLRATDFKQRKTEYFSGGKAYPYHSKQRFKLGERILLDSYMLSPKGIERHLSSLERRYKIRMIADTTSRQGQFMADDLAETVRENGNYRIIMNRLFKWQNFRTVVVEIEGPK